MSCGDDSDDVLLFWNLVVGWGKWWLVALVRRSGALMTTSAVDSSVMWPDSQRRAQTTATKSGSDAMRNVAAVSAGSIVSVCVVPE